MSQVVAIREAAEFVRQRWPLRPRVGIVLGTGFGGLVQLVQSPVAVNFEQIPHFPRASALGHAGRLVCGTLAGVPVMAMAGRLHAYEGHSPQQIVLPVRMMEQLGVETLVLSNASGGVHPRLSTGDLVVIHDHLNLMWRNTLIGPHDPLLGPRLPDMSPVYDRLLIDQALRIGRQRGFPVLAGTYAAMTGPNYETRAEYRFLRKIGVDVVGMSTVPEAIAAAQAGMRVLALSAVTNVCRPDHRQPTSGGDVLAVAESTQPRLRAIVMGVLARLSA
jgi:purine-nucleoside phosphorylase